MRVGRWSAGGEKDSWMGEPHVVSRDCNPQAFMEELCDNQGGYDGFFWTLIWHYMGWWVAVVAVPAIFLDHHKCEAKMSYVGWLLYSATFLGVLAMSVLMELSVVQKLGLLARHEFATLFTERRWQLPLLTTVLWKLDTYTDVVFIFIAHDCGSMLWWASLATFVFGMIFGQLLFNTCFAFTDCDRELPGSFGFFLLDFKIVNAAVRHVLPFDPDANHLPVAKPITLKSASHLIGLEKVVGDIAQVSIQGLFLYDAKAPNHVVFLSVLFGVLHAALTLGVAIRDCMQEDWTSGVSADIALLPQTALDDLSGCSMQLDGIAGGSGTIGSHLELEPTRGGSSSASSSAARYGGCGDQSNSGTGFASWPAAVPTEYGKASKGPTRSGVGQRGDGVDLL